MGCFMDYYRIEVEGGCEAIASIKEAIEKFSPDCIIEQEKNVISVWETLCVEDEDDACDFARLLARAANGSNFKMEGTNEYSVGGGIMFFLSELKNGELTFQHSDYCDEYSSEMFEDCDTYEEFCEMYDDEISEDGFKKIKENEFTYHIDGEIFVDIPLGEVILLDY